MNPRSYLTRVLTNQSISLSVRFFPRLEKALIAEKQRIEQEKERKAYQQQRQSYQQPSDFANYRGGGFNSYRAPPNAWGNQYANAYGSSNYANNGWRSQQFHRDRSQYAYQQQQQQRQRERTQQYYQNNYYGGQGNW